MQHKEELLITVILPVYNGEPFIAAACKSIQNQTEQRFECIIIDDGSTDDSLETIKPFLTDKRFILISRENRGLIETLNQGILLSSGKYIARMDADDISAPNRFELQLEFMEKNSSIGACGSFMEEFGLKDRLLWNYVHNHAIQLAIYFDKRIPLFHPTAFIRKSILEKYQLQYMNYPYAEDYALWLTVAKCSKLHNIPKVLLKYRIHESSVSTTKKAAQSKTRELIRSDLLTTKKLHVLQEHLLKIYLKSYKLVIKLWYLSLKKRTLLKSF